ncbi:hypothetical protein [Pseudorhodoplanes sp.]|uniref:hypothetical protein n=1 Tax=Pseudorhodoplanes sp. TaxID=1934341 RepID=UPI003D14BC1B
MYFAFARISRIVAAIVLLLCSSIHARAASACELVQLYFSSPPKSFVVNRVGQPFQKERWKVQEPTLTGADCYLSTSKEVSDDDRGYFFHCSWLNARPLFDVSFRELKACVPRIIRNKQLKFKSERKKEDEQYKWEVETDTESFSVGLSWKFGVYLLSIEHWKLQPE